MKNKTIDMLEQFSPNLDIANKLIKKRANKFFNGKDKLLPQFSELTKCYNCNSAEISSEFKVDRFRYVRCRKCGMIYVNPRLKADIINFTYGEDEYTTFQYKTKIIPDVCFRRNVLAVRKYNQIMQYFNKPGKVLDIGCGIGEVLSILKEKKWDCLGVEYNKFAADYARNTFGLNVIQKSVHDFKTSQKYDCVMIWGVLEHFTNPKKVLRQTRNLLKNNGLLVVEVPSADSLMVKFIESHGLSNIYSPMRILVPDRHLMLFSHNSMEQMLEACGFEIVFYATNGLDMPTLIRILKIKADDTDFIEKIQGVVDKSNKGDLIRVFAKHKK